MTIFVDADACPRPVKDILYRAAERVKINLVLVANQSMVHPRSPYISMQVVGRGFDVADDWIAEQATAADLVITHDIPLAAAVAEKGGVCIDPRGDVIDATNAAARLRIRDFMEARRQDGEMTGGPPPFGDKDKRKFAASLDRWLSRHARR